MLWVVYVNEFWTSTVRAGSEDEALSIVRDAHVKHKHPIKSIRAVEVR